MVTCTLFSRCTNKLALETFQISVSYPAAKVSEAAAAGTFVVFCMMENRTLTPLNDN